jgi:hypothetical protein
MPTFRLRIIAEWLAFVGVMCLTIAGAILATVLYPLILLVQMMARILDCSKAAAIIGQRLWTRITISLGR